MINIKSALGISWVGAFIIGCAASHQDFTNNGDTFSDTKVCRNYIDDKAKLRQDYKAIDNLEVNYLNALKTQIDRRSLQSSKCKALIKSQNAKIAGSIAAITVAAAAIKYGGSGSSHQSGYAWDQFYDGNYNLTWRCRDKSNGQFAYNSSCSNQIKSDNTWPDK
jgi:hypothetical protein